MKANLFFFIAIAVAVTILSSCAKEESVIQAESSQLWMKANDSFPDFEAEFISFDLNKHKKINSVSYVSKAFRPNLEAFAASDRSGTWVLTHKSYARTDEIIIKLEDGREYQARGFERGEKRFIELILNPDGSASFADRDILTIDTIIYID